MNNELIKGYVQEAVANKKKQDSLKEHFKEIVEAVKESEEQLGITVKEFKAAVDAAYDYDKTQEKIDNLVQAITTVDSLKI